MKTQIITIKKLKKDGSIDASITDLVSMIIIDGKMVLMPVDSIYGIVSTPDQRSHSAIERLTGDRDQEIVRMISSFKMLDEIAMISKMEFDFLHRIWPGELIVYVRDIKNPGRAIPVRMPKSKYLQDVIERVGRPLVYSALNDANRRPVFRKKDIVTALDGKIECLLIIEEFGKEHALPSVVDISSGALDIINEGRVSAEEIKSLYFLGKDDSVM
ncbi:MAG: hypothetical protein A2176_01040 [Spirochaetes bacterium RBG_13_51_14]|nr:MAG: hypothetical protein A2176_01040 [Spirochaetes bacterium RBG_13_51_14]